MNTRRFQDKVALVTGGNSGIGRATALAFGREGAKVVIAARREKEGADVVNEIKACGGEAFFVKTDLMESGQINNLFATIREKYGKLNLAFNNAGIWPKMKLAANYTVEEFDAVMNINVKAVWRCMKQEIPMMTEAGGGSIVNCSSVAGWTGEPGSSLYTASKHAVIGLTRAAAIEFGRKNIRINAVCPGMTETPMLDQMLQSGGPEIKETLLNMIPLKRFGKPEEIAGTVLFLCSNAASYITAKSLMVGGRTGHQTLIILICGGESSSPPQRLIQRDDPCAFRHGQFKNLSIRRLFNLPIGIFQCHGCHEIRKADAKFQGRIAPGPVVPVLYGINFPASRIITDEFCHQSVFVHPDRLRRATRLFHLYSI